MTRTKGDQGASKAAQRSLAWHKRYVIPPEFVATVSCSTCQVLLHRAENFWCCPFGHTKLIADGLLLKAITTRWTELHRRWKAGLGKKPQASPLGVLRRAKWQSRHRKGW